MDSKRMVIHNDPEVIAYIHQITEDFEPYMTESCLLSIDSKSPRKVIALLQSKSELHDDFKATHCYRIQLESNGSKMVAYGLGNDAYSALRQAKEKLLKELHLIYDEVVTNAERVKEINSALSPLKH